MPERLEWLRTRFVSEPNPTVGSEKNSLAIVLNRRWAVGEVCKNGDLTTLRSFLEGGEHLSLRLNGQVGSLMPISV